MCENPAHLTSARLTYQHPQQAQGKTSDSLLPLSSRSRSNYQDIKSKKAKSNQPNARCIVHWTLSNGKPGTIQRTRESPRPGTPQVLRQLELAVNAVGAVLGPKVGRHFTGKFFSAGLLKSIRVWKLLKGKGQRVHETCWRDARHRLV